MIVFQLFEYTLPFLFSLVLVFLPAYYRTTWNTPYIALGSDPQIKYYQAIQMHKEGLKPSALECIYPAEKLGFPKENLPFGYPWAFIIQSKCFFQYPFIFSFVQYLLGGFFTISHFLYIPIFLFFLNYWLVYGIFKSFKYPHLLAGSLSFLLHGFTPVFLSALDYSELSFTNFLVCIYIYCISKIELKSIAASLILGGVLALNFQTRPESTIGLVLFTILYYIFLKDYKKNFYFFFYIGFSFLIVIGLFAFFYLVIYGNPLGLRGLNTLQDASGALPRNYFQDWKADLFGSEFKIGLFQGFPVVLGFLSLVIFIKQTQSAFTRALLLGGSLFILILPIISPYRAGVDIFGMRYFETGIYLLTIGFGLGLKEILLNYPARFPYLILVLILSLSYFSYKSILRAIKHWSSAANLSHELYREFQKIQPDLIVHKGLSTSYLLGITYLKFPQVAIFTKEEWKTIEKLAYQNKLKKVLFLEWKENSLFNKEIPTSIWEKKFGIDFEISPQDCSLESKKKIIHFEAKIYECKENLPHQ